ncbi:hypothetical protein F2P81_025629 [Scophthalmus maximus]|uniref:Uncharacterized protein n=1 Tax=Scophthalmus maximus TaxID=52904 RepID=A0A6A4RPW9_SCOMX|nr:hypothetical protein F2P81_025629 [Scophthalmus maximus]
MLQRLPPQLLRTKQRPVICEVDQEESDDDVDTDVTEPEFPTGAVLGALFVGVVVGAVVVLLVLKKKSHRALNSNKDQPGKTGVSSEESALQTLDEDLSLRHM